MFDTDEQHERISELTLADRREEFERKLRLVRDWATTEDVAGVILAGADSIAWLTGGLTCPIERGVTSSPLRLVVTAERVEAVTTNVERERIEAESPLASFGVTVHQAPWFEPDGLDRVALELADSAPDQLASDRVSQAGRNCEDDLVELRLALTAPEQSRLAVLAADAAGALEEALAAWRPGELDYEVLARADEALERTGAFAACLIVGGDERVERFRHPLAAGASMRRFVMAVVVAERHGLHAAVTRFACADGVSDSLSAARAAAIEVESAMLEATAARGTYGEVLLACERAYAGVGQPGAWRQHYQGGPVGYRQREFEIVPTQRESRWFDQGIETGHAVAWNPSLAGGGKAEDTYLLEPGGLRRLTETGRWPLEDGRPAILDVTTGAAA